jgi:hypothetical protein
LHPVVYKTLGHPQTAESTEELQLLNLTERYSTAESTEEPQSPNSILKNRREVDQELHGRG